MKKSRMTEVTDLVKMFTVFKDASIAKYETGTLIIQLGKIQQFITDKDWAQYPIETRQVLSLLWPLMHQRHMARSYAVSRIAQPPMQTVTLMHDNHVVSLGRLATESHNKGLATFDVIFNGQPLVTGLTMPATSSDDPRSAVVSALRSWAWDCPNVEHAKKARDAAEVASKMSLY